MVDISIIIPIYNVEKYIGKCLDSILGQSFENFEVILVDDGSTDKSGEICKEYSNKDKRIKVIHKKNGGVSSARNTGIKVSNGKYIQFVDADDYIDKNLLEYGYKKMNDEVDLVFYSILEEDDKGRIINKKIASSHLIDNCNRNINHTAINLHKEDLFGYAWCKLFKKEIIISNNIFFDENISLAEDEKFTCDYFKYVRKISILPSTYYHYIKYDDTRGNLSRTQKNNLKKRDSIFLSWMMALNNYDNDVFVRKYLATKSYSSILYDMWNITFIESDKLRKLDTLKSTYLYKFLSENYINLEQKFLIKIIENNSFRLFRIYNKVHYLINKRR